MVLHHSTQPQFVLKMRGLFTQHKQTFNSCNHVRKCYKWKIFDASTEKSPFYSMCTRLLSLMYKTENKLPLNKTFSFFEELANKIEHFLIFITFRNDLPFKINEYFANKTKTCFLSIWANFIANEEWRNPKVFLLPRIALKKFLSITA